MHAFIPPKCWVALVLPPNDGDHCLVRNNWNSLWLVSCTVETTKSTSPQRWWRFAAAVSDTETLQILERTQDYPLHSGGTSSFRTRMDRRYCTNHCWHWDCRTHTGFHLRRCRIHTSQLLLPGHWTFSGNPGRRRTTSGILDHWIIDDTL